VPDFRSRLATRPFPGAAGLLRLLRFHQRTGGASVVKRILHLTLHRRWFDAIASGAKRFEYRTISPYWEKRFFTPVLVRVFDEIHFRNGYHPDAPWMRVEWKGLGICGVAGKPTYRIALGERLEIRNWEGPKA